MTLTAYIAKKSTPLLFSGFISLCCTRGCGELARRFAAGGAVGRSSFGTVRRLAARSSACSVRAGDSWLWTTAETGSI